MADRQLKTEITLRRAAVYLHTRRQDRLAAPLFRSQKGGAFSQCHAAPVQPALRGSPDRAGEPQGITDADGHASLTPPAIYVQGDPERLPALVKKLR